MEDVSVEQALDHPTWRMGGRITIDSATLVNKGLEVIEAHVLFGFAFDDIEVIVHPQSLVHSLVRLADGALLAHVGHADMRVPIQYALTTPERRKSTLPRFDLAGRTLQFEHVDHAAFPALGLAYAAGRAGGGMPAVFNAADEIAVAAFLQGRLGFNGIARVIDQTMAQCSVVDPASVAEVIDIDADARGVAAALVSRAC
jgi:1-deoxy-D-xylulose-5-phosphate reductoisomerase